MHVLAAGRHEPDVRRYGSRFGLVIQIADFEGVEMLLDLFLVRRVVLSYECERGTIWFPRKLLHPVLRLCRLQRVAAVHGQYENLWPRVVARAGVRNECEPVAGRRPPRRV